MSSVIADLIARYGGQVTLSGANCECRITAILQPMRRRSEDQKDRKWQTLGGQPPGQYLLLSTECPDGYDMVERDGVSYWLRRWEPYLMGGEPLYYWSVLTKEG